MADDIVKAIRDYDRVAIGRGDRSDLGVLANQAASEIESLSTQLAASEQARMEAEKERDGLRVERDHQADLLVRHRAMGAVEDAWRWEGDQQRDDLESLTGGVLIAADDLRDVFARAERAEAERDRLQRKLNEKTVELGTAYEIAEDREVRLAAADRLAEAVGPPTHLVGDGWSWGVTLSPEKRDRILKTLADYEAARKGEEG